MQLTPRSRAGRRRAARRPLSSTPPTCTGARRATRSSSARSSTSPTSPLPESVRDAVIAQNGWPLAPKERHCIELLVLRPRGRQQRAARGPRPLGGGRSGCSRPPACSTRSGRGVAFRHEIARSAVLGAVALGAEPALHATMIHRARGGSAATRACSPTTRSAALRRGTDPALRGRGRRGVGAGGRAPGGRRVLRARPAPRGPTPQGRPTCSRRSRSSCTSPTSSTTRSPPASSRSPCAATSPTPPPSAPGTPRSPAWAWYDADLGHGRPPQGRRDRDPLRHRRRPGAGLRVGQPLLPRGPAGATWPRPVPRAPAQLQLADRGAIRCCTALATIGVAVARLLDGDVHGAGGPPRGPDAGLRQHHDDLATTPMSNLCHLDVEQGRFDDAEESIASALRISEERDTPICNDVAAGGAGPAAAAAGRLARGRTRRPRRARRR